MYLLKQIEHFFEETAIGQFLALVAIVTFFIGMYVVLTVAK